MVRSLALMVVLVACSDDPRAREPDADADGETVATIEDTSVAIDVAPVARSMVIGSQGGALTSSDGVVTITVPPDAVLSDTTFSITTDPSAPQGARVGGAYRLTPDVVDFARPITVTFTAPDIDAATSLLVFDEQRLVWLPLGRSKVAGQVVSAQRWHFSRYSYGDDAAALALLGALPVELHEGAIAVAASNDNDTATGIAPKEFGTLEAACVRVRADLPFIELGAGGSPVRVHRYHRVTRVELGEGTFAGATCDVAVRGRGRALTQIGSALRVHGALESSGAFTIHASGDCVVLESSTLADAAVSTCDTGVELRGASAAVEGSVVRDNRVGVQVTSGQGHRLSGNTLACNTERDVDARVPVDASNNAWDHVPPTAEDYSGEVVTTNATLAVDPCAP